MALEHDLKEWLQKNGSFRFHGVEKKQPLPFTDRNGKQYRFAESAVVSFAPQNGYTQPQRGMILEGVDRLYFQSALEEPLHSEKILIDENPAMMYIEQVDDIYRRVELQILPG